MMVMFIVSESGDFSRKSPSFSVYLQVLGYLFLKGNLTFQHQIHFGPSVSKKKYLHGKRVYEYERFYVPVPKRFQQIVKPS